MVKDLELAILTEKEPKDSKHEVMVQQAQDVDEFFSAFPRVLRCLTRLHLHNVRFAGRDMNHLLFDCCKQLLHLSLNHCDTGDYSVWKIHAPDSNLRVLEVYFSRFKRAEVLCLPTTAGPLAVLVLLRGPLEFWLCPVTQGIVPCL